MKLPAGTLMVTGLLGWLAVAVLSKPKIDPTYVPPYPMDPMPPYLPFDPTYVPPYYPPSGGSGGVSPGAGSIGLTHLYTLNRELFEAEKYYHGWTFTYEQYLIAVDTYNRGIS